MEASGKAGVLPPLALFSPARPSLAGAPTWKDFSQLVLPRLQLVFYPDAMIGVQFMFPSKYGQGAFSWVEARLEEKALLGFLEEWRTSPEDTLQKYYRLEPPSAGAGGWGGVGASTRPSVVSTGKTLEELDL